jgi:HEAT repeat protein
MGPGARAAVPVLLREVQERGDYGWSGRLVEALAAVGPETLPPLFQVLRRKPPWPDLDRHNSLVDLLCPCYGPAALPFLLKQLQAGQPDQRLLAALALGEAAEAAAGLRQALGDADPLVRYGAAISLARLGARDKGLLPIALAGLRQCPDSRSAGLPLLMRLGEEHPAAVDALADYLDDPDAWPVALRLLARLGPKAAPVAARAARLVDEHMSHADMCATLDLLATRPSDPMVADALRRALRDDVVEPKVLVALSALGKVDPASAATLRAVAELLDGNLRLMAHYYLRRLGPRAGPVVPKLVVLVQREQDDGAMWTLGAIGAEAAPALDSLHAVARWGKEPDRRQNAMCAVARIAPGDESTLLLLAEIAADERHYYVRRWAVITLVSMARAAKVPPVLLGRLASEDAAERLRAAIAVAAIEKRLDTALPALASLLEHPDFEIRWELLVALGDLASPAVIPLLEKALSDPCDRVRNAALGRLAELGPPARAVLRGALKHSDPATRLRAAHCLAPDAAEHAKVAATLQPLLSDPDEQREALEILSAHRVADPALERDLVRLLSYVNVPVRVHAAWLLGYQKRLSRSSVAALQDALADPNMRVRATAAEALVRVDPKAATEVAPAVVQALVAVPPGPAGYWRYLPAQSQVVFGDRRAALVRLGPAALPTLLELLTDRACEDPEELRRLVSAILASRMVKPPGAG